MLSATINGLAVLSQPSDNGMHEAQRCKKLRKGTSGEEANSTPRRLFVAASRRRAGPQNSQLWKGYLRREEEKERQSRTASSSLFGSSSSCSPRIAWRNSASVSSASASLTCRNNSAFCFLAFKSSGRLPRLFSSAITSRMSSSKGSSGMLKTRNNNSFYIPQSLIPLSQSSLGKSAWQLTVQNRPVYTVSPRWICFLLRRASSHSARSQLRSQRPLAGISELSNLREPPATRP
jgi:hypothetical protein